MRRLFFFYVFSILSGVVMLACRGNEKERKTVKAAKVKYEETKALTLIRKDDCLSCHSIEDKSVGPAYVKIAERYESDDITINKLADKIIAGGGGLWGGMMTSHPYLKKQDAVKIVRWVLSLDDSLSNPDPLLATPAIGLANAFEEGADARPRNGLTIRSYSLKSLGNDSPGFPDISTETPPTHSGIIPKIHFAGDESFEPLSEDFVLQATGFINIKTKGKYFLKQVRRGKGRVFVNGEKKINENEWDSETHIDLSPGVYPITVEYLPGPGKKSLSLQWITPENEYYEVIPTEAFTYQ